MEVRNLRLTIDGAAYRKMLLSAAASIEINKQKINDLNVFPVPDGDTDEDNVEVRRFMEPTEFSFEPKAHWDLGEGLGILDAATAAKITGTAILYALLAIIVFFLTTMIPIIPIKPSPIKNFMFTPATNNIASMLTTIIIPVPKSG